MPEWIPFTYREFYDHPRMLVLWVDGARLLLWSRFDPQRDTYDDHYQLHRLPPELQIDGSWAELPIQDSSPIGSIPIADLEFDETRRRVVRVDQLRAILAAPSVPPRPS